MQETIVTTGLIYEDNGLRINLTPILDNLETLDEFQVVRFVAGNGEARAHSLATYENTVPLPDDAQFYENGELVDMCYRGTYIEISKKETK